MVHLVGGANSLLTNNSTISGSTATLTADRMVLGSTGGGESFSVGGGLAILQPATNGKRSISTTRPAIPAANCGCRKMN